MPPPSVRDRIMPPRPASVPASAPTLSQQPSGKASRDEAGFIPAGQQCGDCSNYQKETGDCSKVDGQFQAGDSCSKYFSHAKGGMAASPEPDADDGRNALLIGGGDES